MFSKLSIIIEPHIYAELRIYIPNYHLVGVGIVPIEL